MTVASAREYEPLTPRERTSLREALPPEVRNNSRLVGWLAQRAENYRNVGAVDEDGDPIEPDWPSWKEPRKRDLEAVVSSVKRLVEALERLHPRIVVSACRWTSAETAERFISDLWGINAEAQHWLHKRTRRKPGTKPDLERMHLEEGVALDLHNAGVPLRKSRGGARGGAVFGRTLQAVYQAAGIPVPSLDSMFPRLKELANYRSDPVRAARRRPPR